MLLLTFTLQSKFGLKCQHNWQNLSQLFRLYTVLKNQFYLLVSVLLKCFRFEVVFNFNEFFSIHVREKRSQNKQARGLYVHFNCFYSFYIWYVLWVYFTYNFFKWSYSYIFRQFTCHRIICTCMNETLINDWFFNWTMSSKIISLSYKHNS